MSFEALLIANRAEIAIRIARAAADLGLPSVAVYSQDDAASLHTRVADDAYALAGTGPRAYLDADAIIAAAKETGCDAIHPGYGFLAERPDFALLCADHGITFVGPSPADLALFGDKAKARAAAMATDVPVLHGLDHGMTVDEAKAFFDALGPDSAMIVKAVAGGGGRGTRVVTRADEIESVFERCRSEATAAFGLGDLYVEEFVPRARHVEVQILGDLKGHVTHLGERECSIQRRFQKVVEVAPAPGLSDALRTEIIDAAVRLAKHTGYTNLGTFEFLVDVTGRTDVQPYVFIEANARLQVEHTVTEAVTGVDLVQSQIRLAAGESLTDIGLDAPHVATPRGYAVQARVNMETPREDGTVHPSGGRLTAYEAPNGPGVRTDGFGYAGYATSAAFDSLLAKVIVHSPSPDLARAASRAARALSEFRLDGVGTNVSFLRNILEHARESTRRIPSRSSRTTRR
ncbi:MAG: biotin carboxylase N-terminal domain-containing protein [Gammaproteobacteria bacterium]